MNSNSTTNPRNIQNHKCENCGFVVSRPSVFHAMMSGEFDRSQNGDYLAERVTPIRSYELEADVLVPAVQSLVWGIVTALPAVAVSMWLRWEWYSPVVVGSISVLASWIASMRRSELNAMKSERFSFSSDQDDNASAPGAPATGAIKLEVTTKDGVAARSMKIVDLPEGVSEKKFVSFCSDILAGRRMSRSNWAGSGKLLSRDEYDDLMRAMDDAGLCLSVPGKGRRLSVGGKHAIKRMIREAV